jgi:hypothetical protein
MLIVDHKAIERAGSFRVRKVRTASRKPAIPEANRWAGSESRGIMEYLGRRLLFRFDNLEGKRECG